MIVRTRGTGKVNMDTTPTKQMLSISMSCVQRAEGVLGPHVHEYVPFWRRKYTNLLSFVVAQTTISSLKTAWGVLQLLLTDPQTWVVKKIFWGWSPRRCPCVAPAHIVPMVKKNAQMGIPLVYIVIPLEYRIFIEEVEVLQRIIKKSMITTEKKKN